MHGIGRLTGVALLALCAHAAMADDLPFLVAALGSPDEGDAQDAQRRLLVAGPDAVPLLLTAIDDERARAQWRTKSLARGIQDLGSEDYATREGAEQRVWEFGREAIPLLQAAAAGDNPEVRARAQSVLARLGQVLPPCPINALPRLLKALEASPTDACVPEIAPLARAEARGSWEPALDCLTRLGSPAARAVLHEIAEGPASPKRGVARLSLLQLGERPCELTPELLREDHEDPARGMRLFTEFARSHDPEVVRFAMHTFATSKGTDHGWFAREFLDGIADRSLLVRLAQEELGSAPAALRFRSQAFACVTPEDRGSLEEALMDPDPWVASSAASSLVDLLGKEALPLLDPLAKDPRSMVRLAWLQAQVRLASADSAAFEAMSQDPDPSVQKCARAALLPRAHPLLLHIREGRQALSPEEEDILDQAVSFNLAPEFEPHRTPSLVGPGQTLPARTFSIHWRRIGSPVEPDPSESVWKTFFDFLHLDATAQREEVRRLLADNRGELQPALPLWVVFADVPGLEEEMFGQLSTSPWAALTYLEPRRNADLLDRVRCKALSNSPRGAAELWVRWEGRKAVEALLARIAEGDVSVRDLLPALAEGPLVPRDDGLLMEQVNWSAGVSGALLRTGSPRARSVVLDLVINGLDPDTQRTLPLLLREADSRGSLLKYGMIAPPPLVLAICGALRDAPGPDAVPFLLHALDLNPGLLSACVALARSDRAAALGAAQERLASFQRIDRTSACLLFLACGEGPPTEAVEGIGRNASAENLATMRFVARHATPALLQALLPRLQDRDPLVREQVWSLLVRATGQAPPGAENCFFLPSEARAAWQAWLDAHRGTTREDWLREAVEQGGFGKGPEARLRAFLEGPWYLAQAVRPDGDLDDRSAAMTEGWSFEALARWRASLR